MKPETRIVDRWHGAGAEAAAWAACHATAAVLRRVRVTARYGVTVHKARVTVARLNAPSYRTWEWRLVVVDRHPDAGPPPPAIARLHDRIRTPLTF